MERYLERCLNSLIVSDELMEKLEVLVINDGSKDHSSEIAHSYEKKYPQTFRVIDKENGNYGSCVNRGLKEATGKYIKILDADDWFDTMNFADFVELLGTIDVDCVMSDTVKVDEEGLSLGYFNYPFPQKTVFDIKNMMEHNFNKTMHSVCYKTDNLRSVGYHQSEGISYTDTEWIYMPITTCNSIYYYPKVVYKYLIGRNGQTMSPQSYKKSFWQDIKVEMVMAIFLQDKQGQFSSAHNKYLQDLLLSHARFIYCHYFIDFRMNICYDEMVKLDKLLLNVSPYVCEELDKLYRLEPLNFHFVKIWRKRDYPRILWTMKLGMFISDTIRHIKGLVKI